MVLYLAPNIYVLCIPHSIPIVVIFNEIGRVRGRGYFVHHQVKA